MAQAESENVKSSWELSKENIQPLSSGRNMACLTRSLETSLPHSEVEMLDTISEFEAAIKEYSGSDPLEPWIRLINYLEQNSLSVGKYAYKYASILSRCVRAFLYKEQQQNDKRFVDIFIKSLHGFQPERRVLILKNAMLNNGVGSKVSRMYIAIAEDYIELQQFQAADELLQKGITEMVQPVEYLEDALLNLQLKLAEFVTKSVAENKGGSGCGRLFGGSIPCGPTNEAPSIRYALSPANPSRSKPRTDIKKIPLYQGENVQSIESSEPAISSYPVNEIERVQNEKENELVPTTWNKPNSEMFTEANGRSLETIALYADTEEYTALQSEVQKTARRPALGEIKITELPDAENAAPTVEKETVSLTSSEPISETKCETKVRSKSSLVENPERSEASKQGVKSNETCIPPKEKSATVQLAVPPPGGNIRIMYRKDQLWQNGREVSFEHIRAAEYRKRGIHGLKAKANENENAEATSADRVCTVESSGEESDQKAQRIKALELELSAQQTKFMEEKNALVDEISRLKIQKSNEVTQAVQQAKNECVQECQADIIKLRREKSEILTALREEKLRRLNLEDEYSKILEEYRKLSLHNQIATDEVNALRISPAGLNTAPQILETAIAAAAASNFELFADTSIRASENNVPVPSNHFDEQNKENVMQGEERPEEKSRRTFSGVLTPSINPVPQALVFDVDGMDYDMGPEDTEVLLKKNETAVDFNVSNLTRALDFNPRPLGNSTPERRRSDSPEPDEELYGYRMPGVAPLAYGSNSVHLPSMQYNMTYQPRPNFNQTLPNVQNLSTIQETSKENRSSCTASSSSSNRTTASTFCSTGNFTRSASRHQISHYHQGGPEY